VYWEYLLLFKPEHIDRNTILFFELWNVHHFYWVRDSIELQRSYMIFILSYTL
jgi:hypothetical protein